MSPEAQRIAIAEACGYKLTPLPQNPAQKAWTLGIVQAILPDYLNDLNAMHEAEKTLNEVREIHFCNALFSVIFKQSPVNVCTEFDKVHATAAQRAEAFLRTIGKWEGQ